ncbi:carotenoid oxygenase family protein [Oxynema aestuarii]|uniref:Apocarotenoid-15,15'-oxygenase n=1 Tax=Oxynema aestuarii AP17 TaxID=2064643 RepID=A0A6H1U154_9CYAN|nr:carotenoid oxygenase family protein [Oxynema aestuarii]QIZ72117.1 Apocarotenoid-15,15'-oxygenase [Oxynema aestuarii AP17]
MQLQDKSQSPNVDPLDSKSYSREDWKQGYQSQPEEFSYWIDEIDGEIPPDLCGTFFRNGPGLLDIHEQPIHHPFDGDGMICKIGFKDGRAHFQNRFVRTKGYVEEREAGKILYRGVFGTQKPGGWLANFLDLRVKNIANTHVIYWGEKLLALWEAAQPHRLDPESLETVGLDDLDGLLESGKAFAAHPRIDPACAIDEGAPCLVNFAVKPGPKTTIAIYEFDPAGNLRRHHEHSVPGFAFLHDMAITPNYCIFFQNPVSFHPLPYFLGLKGAGQCIRFNPKAPTKVIVIPRDGSSQVQIVETEPCFVFHHANAWEENGKIYIDSVCYESFPSIQEDGDFREVDFDALPEGQLWRFEIDEGRETVGHQVLSRRCCEFPVLHPARVGRPYRYLYLGVADRETGNAPLQAVMKWDAETGDRQVWSAAPRGFGGEPLFVPRPGGDGEDDGWVLLLVYDAARHGSDLVILDARAIASGPIARLHLKHHIPYGLHGSFTPECFV